MQDMSRTRQQSRFTRPPQIEPAMIAASKQNTQLLRPIEVAFLVQKREIALRCRMSYKPAAL
ncbi:MAG: hypothetical protein DMG95_03785 [Acidobacteria bacterium]|nr:MAG: hypothetical protein DMG95_03785 [Acidobacteriota bacterium]